jgi:hypothetical protein
MKGNKMDPIIFLIALIVAAGMCVCFGVVAQERGDELDKKDEEIRSLNRFIKVINSWNNQAKSK